MANGEHQQTLHLNLHIKILTPPSPPPDGNTIANMMAAMNETFSRANVTVNLVTTDEMDLTRDEFEFFNSLFVGECNVAPSDEQIELSAFRANAAITDVVVYICETVMNDLGALDGCSTHPQGIPMAVIRSSCALYTLAHEIGHLLGLDHSPDQLTHRLMNPAPANIDAPAKLIKSEIKKMRQSGLLN
jgi:Predicted Zn-dependent proteases